MEVNIRPWRMDDLDKLVEYADNHNIAKNLTDAFPSPYTIEDGRRFLDAVMSCDPQRFFAIETDGQLVGSIAITPQTNIHRKSAEIGYFLAEPFWGRGIMPIAIRKIVEYGFTTFDINRIFAHPFGTNKASRRVLEKAGFSFEAKFDKTLIKNDQLIDEIYYSIRR